MSNKHRVENAVQLANVLARRVGASDRSVTSDVLELQRIARAIHKIDERGCCEDLGCQNCDGNGLVENKGNGARRGLMEDCHYCAGMGRITGKREVRLIAKARAIAEAYSMRLYEQGDCRGWPLYLIPEESPWPKDEDQGRYSSCPAVCPS